MVPHVGSFLSIPLSLFLNLFLNSSSSTHIFSLVANELSIAGVLFPVRHGPLQRHEVAVVHLKTSHTTKISLGSRTQHAELTLVTVVTLLNWDPWSS